MPLKMLEPGMYEKDGELHIDCEEMAAHLGIDAEWVNEHIDRLLKQAWAEAYPDEPLPEIVDVEGPPAWKGQG